MSEATIEVQRREQTGKGTSRRLRAAGIIPAVLYGADRDPVSIQIPRKTLIDLFKAGGHENRIFLLKLSGTDQSRHAMIRDLYFDPTTNQISHLDFQRIAMDRKLRVRVHLTLDGTPRGVKTDGGMMDFVTREIEVECLPGKIPAEIHVDVSELGIDEHLDISQVVMPEGVEYVGAADLVVASVKHARVEEAPVAGAAVAAAPVEPEVVQRGKKEEAASS